LQVATGNVVDDLYFMSVKIRTKEVSGKEDRSCLSFSTQQETADVENLPPGHDTDDQQSVSKSEERGETGSVIREDDSKSSHGSSCGSQKPVFTIVLDSNLTKPNESPVVQAIPASTTKWDTVLVVHDRNLARSEDGLKLLEPKPNIDVAVDGKHAVICSSDEPFHFHSTSEVQFNKNHYTDNVEPTHSTPDLDSRPKSEKNSSTQAFSPTVSYPENHHASSGNAKKVFTIILDVDSPALSSDKCQLLSGDNVSAPEDSSTDKFSQTEVKNQQRKPECQGPKGGLSEKDDVKSSCSELQPERKEEMQHKTHEIMEIYIQKCEKEKQHEIIEAETSSQMDFHTGEGNDLGSVVHQQDVTMLESHDEDEKNKFAEPSNEANRPKKPPNVDKCKKKKNRKSAGVKQPSNINSRSDQKNKTDSENLQTSEVRLLDITGTSLTVSSDCSHPNTSKPFSTEDKLTKVVDAVQPETLNLLQTETKDKQLETISISLDEEATGSVVLATMETAHTEDSETMLTDASPVTRDECITQILTAVPSKSQLHHAEAQRTDDSDGSFPLQQVRFTWMCCLGGHVQHLNEMLFKHF